MMNIPYVNEPLFSYICCNKSFTPRKYELISFYESFYCIKCNFI